MIYQLRDTEIPVSAPQLYQSILVRKIGENSCRAYLKVLYPVVPETVQTSSISILDKEDPSDDTFLRRLCC